MSSKALHKARGKREANPHSLAVLSLEEVRASGLPAYFSDHGEHLLYQDGELFDLGDEDATRPAGHQRPTPLPRQILDASVGIEYGWRHAADCGCPYCWKRARTDRAGDAVA